MSDNTPEFSIDYVEDYSGSLEQFEDSLRALRYAPAKALLYVGIVTGWTPNRHKAITLTAKDGTSVTIPTNSGLNNSVFRSLINKIVRHAAPPKKIDKIALVEEITALIKLDPSQINTLRDALEQLPPFVKESQVAAEPEAPSEAKAVKRKRRIVKEEPWSAHRNSRGETYPSEAVMERTWNLAPLTDYACRFDGCDFTDESPHTVAHHHGGHKRGEGRTPQAAIDGIDPNHVPNPRRTTRIRRLRREIDGAFAGALAAGVDTTDALWLATWIIDHRVDAISSSGEDGGTSPLEELTSEEILDRIAALADRGRGKVLREQVDTLQTQVDGYLTMMDDTNEALVAMRARAEAAEGDIEALRDLLKVPRGDQS